MPTIPKTEKKFDRPLHFDTHPGDNQSFKDLGDQKPPEVNVNEIIFPMWAVKVKAQSQAPASAKEIIQPEKVMQGLD
jgi:hypothetical protein